MTARNRNKNSPPSLVGLLPAGGEAKRVEPLPCSKELYPIGFHDANRGLSLRPKVVSHYLLEKMRLANVAKVYVILRKGKWDIPAYFGDGRFLDMHLAYLMMDLPFGVPYTLDQAFPFVQEATVVFGFPDIIFKPDDAFVKLLERQTTSNADIVLGLFIAHQPQKMDMVDLDSQGKIRRIEIKPAKTALRYTWVIAVWNSKFTQYMHDFVAAGRIPEMKSKVDADKKNQKEVFLGDIIQAAIQDDLKINSVLFHQHDYLDIGTPEDLLKTYQVINSAQQK